MKLRRAAIGSKKFGRVKHLRFWSEDPIAEFKRRQSRQTRSKIARALRGKRKRLGKKFADLHGFNKHTAGDLASLLPKSRKHRNIESFVHKGGLAGAGLGASLGGGLGNLAYQAGTPSARLRDPVSRARLIGAGALVGSLPGYIAGRTMGQVLAPSSGVRKKR